MEPVEIAAGRLQLRPWHERDRAVVDAALTDRQITRWWGADRWSDPGAAPPKDADRWLSAQAEAWARETRASFAVMDAVTGEVYGGVHLTLEPERRRAHAGFWLLPAARGHGHATRALATVSRWGVGALGLDRLELVHAAPDTASCVVAVRAGYADVRTEPGVLRARGGAVHDGHRHVLSLTEV